jgi:hypothetical protein
LICFFVGENFCAANYLAYADRSVLFEYLHSYGMVLCFGLMVFAILEGMDRRLIKLSDPESRCAAFGLCRHCIKHADVSCGLQRVFLFVIPAVMIVALAPFCVELATVSYNTTILGSFYNYSHPAVHQVFEVRYLPACALTLLSVSFVLLRFGRRDAVVEGLLRGRHGRLGVQLPAPGAFAGLPRQSRLVRRMGGSDRTAVHSGRRHGLVGVPRNASSGAFTPACQGGIRQTASGAVESATEAEGNMRKQWSKKKKALVIAVSGLAVAGLSYLWPHSIGT